VGVAVLVVVKQRPTGTSPQWWRRRWVSPRW
jgi:hypothetical protein